VSFVGRRRHVWKTPADQRLVLALRWSWVSHVFGFLARKIDPRALTLSAVLRPDDPKRLTAQDNATSGDGLFEASCETRIDTVMAKDGPRALGVGSEWLRMPLEWLEGG
jgi:hypothetical protein